jgi:predicted peroxiredoxin
MKNNEFDIVFKLIDRAVVGVDTYNHNNSRWLIFTDNKRWVIELTKDGTLWYNFYFFKNIFKLISLDVVGNQHYITKWVEDTIINKVRNTNEGISIYEIHVEDVIQNGVKHTRRNGDSMNTEAEDAIKNGVIHTKGNSLEPTKYIESITQNGVKDTIDSFKERIFFVEDTIENGVKETVDQWNENRPSVEDTIKNGVKYTASQRARYSRIVEDTIQNGVKETKYPLGDSKLQVEDTIENGIRNTRWVHRKPSRIVEDTIQNGVRKIEGEPHDYPHTVANIIKNGVKHTEYGDWEDGDERFDDIIKNGVKETKTPGADGDIMGAVDFMSDNNTNNLSQLIDDVIEKGIKYTEGGILFDETKVDRVISEGVKHIEPGGYLGSIEMKGKIVHQFEHAKQNNDVENVIESGIKLTTFNIPLSEDDGQITEIEDVIQNGIKKTFDEAHHRRREVVRTIRDGIKETHDDVYHHKGRVDGVIKNGVKEIKPAYRMIYNPMNFEPVMIEDKRIPDITDVICDGINEVQSLPAQDGNRDWGLYYQKQEDRTKPHTKYVDEVITEGKKIQ